MHNDVTENSSALGDLVLAVASGRAITAGGAMFGSGSASNTDTNGQSAFSNSTTSASYTFTGAYTSAPICTFSPLADPGNGVRLWISTLSRSALQLTASSSISLTVDYQCSSVPVFQEKLDGTSETRLTATVEIIGHYQIRLAAIKVRNRDSKKCRC